ncbi:MAG: DUF917 family protein [Chloroflexi bacterium]|nr:DUF917 family protein [Chloroflexota bacterium]
MEQILDRVMAEAAVYGGAILGGGGGGPIAAGLEFANSAFDTGIPRLVSCDDLAPNDMVVTVSAVGSPATKVTPLPTHFRRAVELMQEYGHWTIAGFVSSENGAIGTINGWLQSALLSIPVVDCPCDGRAHPTGTMGSLGLGTVVDYTSVQVAVARNGLEVLASGPIEMASNLTRRAAHETSSVVAVVRNPVTVSYIQKHGAPGAIRQAIHLGQKLLSLAPRDGWNAVSAIAEELKGTVHGPFLIDNVVLISEGGYDHGAIRLLANDQSSLELTFWNEYMTLEQEGKRLATFPDLITTFGMDGIPLTSTDLVQGRQVYILATSHRHLQLGSGVRAVEDYPKIEKVIQKSMLSYLDFLVE